MRHYLGISAKGPAVFRNVHKDDTGEPLLFLDESEVKKLQINFGQWLESGETVASATATANGVTCSTQTSTPDVTLTLSAASFDGDVKLVVTSSTGEKWRGIIRVRKPMRFGDERWMRDYV